jgi:hypothetical protein
VSSDWFVQFMVGLLVRQEQKARRFGCFCAITFQDWLAFVSVIRDFGRDRLFRSFPVAAVQFTRACWVAQTVIAYSGHGGKISPAMMVASKQTRIHSTSLMGTDHS